MAAMAKIERTESQGKYSALEPVPFRRSYRRKATVSHAVHLGFDPDSYGPSDNEEVSEEQSFPGKGGTAPKHVRKVVDMDEAATNLDLEKGMANLFEKGHNVDSISKFMWSQLARYDLPNFLKFIRLDQDGGLDRVHKDIWADEKIIWAALLFGCLLVNVVGLLTSNWVVFRGFTAELADLGREVAVTPMQEEYSHLSKMTANATLVASKVDDEIRTIYSHIPDKERRLIIISFAGLVGTAEVCWIVLVMLRACLELCLFRFSRSEFRQYFSIMQLFQYTIPMLATFSLIKFATWVHPSLLYTHFMEHQTQVMCCPRTRLGLVITTLWFVIQRLICAFLAFGAFAMKLLSCGLKLIDPNYSFPVCCFLVFNLMLQVLGGIQLQNVLQDRIFLFIFGGPDAVFEDDEVALRNVYRCRVAKQIWIDFWQKGERFKTIVLMATFDHFDLQRLLVEEPDDLVLRKSKTKALVLEAEGGVGSLDGLGSDSLDTEGGIH